MLSHEYLKKSMGCENEISCLAEIGGALGAEFLISGSISLMNETYVLNLILIDIGNNMVKNRISVSYKGKSEELLELVSPYIKILMGGEKSSLYKGKITFLVNEKNASVFIDTKKSGETPIKKPIDLSIGKHTVLVTKPEYLDFEKDIIVRKNLSNLMTIDLIKKSSLIPWYKKWWIWSIAGTLVAGTISSIYYLSSKKDNKITTGVMIQPPDLPVEVNK